MTRAQTRLLVIECITLSLKMPGPPQLAFIYAIRMLVFTVSDIFDRSIYIIKGGSHLLFCIAN